MSSVAESLSALAALPGVPEATAAARDACTALRWHEGLRRRIPQAAAESRVRGARASAALDGAQVSVDLVRDLMRGAAAWPSEPDPLEQVLRGVVQATAETEHLRTLVVTEGSLRGTTLTLGQAPVLIGRAPECTLVLDDDFASARHARLSPQGGEWIV